MSDAVSVAANGPGVPSQGPRVRPVAIKVYLVMRDSNVGLPSEILCAKLTVKAAQAIVDRTVGTRIEKVIADKTEE